MKDGRPFEMRSGLRLEEETFGTGASIERHRWYRVRLRMWLSRGEPVSWPAPWGLVDRAHLEGDGTVMIRDVRIDREFLINGLFYGVQGMRIGGSRTLRISPHLAYGETGVPGMIPENAVLVAQIEILEERDFSS